MYGAALVCFMSEIQQLQYTCNSPISLMIWQLRDHWKVKVAWIQHPTTDGKHGGIYLPICYTAACRRINESKHIFFCCENGVGPRDTGTVQHSDVILADLLMIIFPRRTQESSLGQPV